MEQNYSRRQVISILFVSGYNQKRIRQLKRVLNGINVDDVSIQKAFFYYIFADQFGWTPEQVDKLGQELLLDLVNLIILKQEESERKLKREMRR